MPEEGVTRNCVEFMRLERHRLTTIGEKTREYLKRADVIPTALSLYAEHAVYERTAGISPPITL